MMQRQASEIIGDDIRRLMAEKHVTPEEFCDELDCSYGDFCRVLQGRAFLRPDDLKKVVGLLGIDPMDLFEEE